MTDPRRDIDEPSPTIVGPRPAGGGGGKIAIPRGLERLLSLGGVSAEWRRRIVADPLGAALEAKIELSESERAMVRAVPPDHLSAMAGSFARTVSGGGMLGRVAGAAALALVATGVAGCPTPVGGNRPDMPPPPAQSGKAGLPSGTADEAPAPVWRASLEDALDEAKRETKAVMAVFPGSRTAGKELAPPPPTRGISPDEPELRIEERSARVCLCEARDVRLALRDSEVVPVRVVEPVATMAAVGKESAEALEKGREEYARTLARYGIEAAPAVVFLNPDGAVALKLVRPETDDALASAIRGSPERLARFVAERRRTQDSISPPAGIRPDVPRRGPGAGDR